MPHRAAGSTNAGFKIVLRTSCVAIVLLGGIGCDRASPRAGAGGALRIEACADAAVAQGQFSAEWIVRESDDSRSAVGITATDIALATDQSLFVLDSRENRVLHLSSAGVILARWGHAGDGPGELRSAVAVAVGPDSAIYVANGRGGRITVFKPSGEFVRSIQTNGLYETSDLLVLPNGNIVVATDAILEGGGRPYVAVLGPDGTLKTSVLESNRFGAHRSRPLLAPFRNAVRLSQGPAGIFAVWYPNDNYVELFESGARPLGHVEGCLPRAVRDSYMRQGEHGGDVSTVWFVTRGVGVGTDTAMRVVSMAQADSAHHRVRIRRYVLGRGEVAATDYDVGGAVTPRFMFGADSLVLAFRGEEIVRMRLK